MAGVASQRTSGDMANLTAGWLRNIVVVALRLHDETLDFISDTLGDTAEREKLANKCWGSTTLTNIPADPPELQEACARRLWFMHRVEPMRQRAGLCCGSVHRL